jgi:copper(I)-binding protein
VLRFKLALLFAAMFAQPTIAANLTVSDAWMRALPNRLPAAGYFTLHNLGATEVNLTDARSPACGMLMVHRSASENGMANMTDVDGVPVQARGSVKFAPGGLHLMCMDPKPTLKPGATVPVTLLFSDGESVKTIFAVRNALGR